MEEQLKIKSAEEIADEIAEENYDKQFVHPLAKRKWIKDMIKEAISEFNPQPLSVPIQQQSNIDIIYRWMLKHSFAQDYALKMSEELFESLSVPVLPENKTVGWVVNNIESPKFTDWYYCENSLGEKAMYLFADGHWQIPIGKHPVAKWLNERKFEAVLPISDEEAKNDLENVKKQIERLQKLPESRLVNTVIEDLSDFYVRQFNRNLTPKPVSIRDEDIEKEAKESWMNYEYPDGKLYPNIYREAFIAGAKYILSKQTK